MKNGDVKNSTAADLQVASLVDFAYERLQTLIASGRLAEGSRLIIAELARNFGTSPIPIREALVRLKAERFVTFQPNKGYRVGSKPDTSELAHLFQARVILEVGAIREGLHNVTEDILTKLGAVNIEIAGIRVGSSAAANKAFILHNERFHLLLVSLSANPFVIDAYNRLGYHQRMLHTHYDRGDPDSARVVREHEEIILALRTRKNGPVEKALRDHILFGQTRLREAS